MLGRFRRNLAICGGSGGGGNRTRVLFRSDSARLQALRTFAIAAAALVTASATGTAGTRPVLAEVITVSLPPMTVMDRTTSHAFATDARVHAAVTVDGRDLAHGASGRVVDFAGRGVIVRLVSARGDGPMRIRMASVRERPVRVVVELRW